MANPQKELGYTAIANEILEVLAKTPLNGSQRRIIDIVFRYTYGFNRKEHDLSETFISKATEIHKKQVQRELNQLISSNIIQVIKEATFNTSRIIKFNKNYDSWQVAKKLPPNKKAPHTGSELAPHTGSELAPQERQYKDNIKENIIYLSPGEDELIKALSSIKGYPLNREKEIEMYKRLTERYPNIDIIAVVKEWAISVLDCSLRKSDKPRSQINTWCSNSVKWGKNIKGGKADGSNSGLYGKSGQAPKYNKDNWLATITDSSITEQI